MIVADQLLEQAIPGTELRAGRRYQELKSTIPQAWRIWRGDGTEWAAFLVVGDHVPEIDEHGIRSARRIGLRPVLVITDPSGVRAAAPLYRYMKAYLICEIGGRGSLIPPPSPLPRQRPGGRAVALRIRTELFQDLVDSEHLETDAQAALKTLLRRYRRMSAESGNTDDEEAAALTQFAARVLDGMGLQERRIKTTQMLRSIEAGGFTQSPRDHFFHSFQNYFLGLTAVVRLRPQFEAFKRAVKLDWEINPVDVWFLTAMWHDVGYPFQSVGAVVDAVLGEDDADDIADSLKERFLQRPATGEALRLMSSLIARLLSTGRPRTGWLPPGPKTNLGQQASQLLQAFQQNILSSHGAASAVRLFCDHRDDLEKMGPGVGELLKQTVYLACCSIPFHDWTLRRAVRDTCGSCQLETAAMPFAALLAFVDSIQDDRRDVGASRQAVLILRRILIRQPAVIEADIDRHAIADDALLGKIIECRDVVAALRQERGGPQFRYPSWISGQR